MAHEKLDMSYSQLRQEEPAKYAVSDSNRRTKSTSFPLLSNDLMLYVISDDHLVSTVDDKEDTRFHKAKK